MMTPLTAIIHEDIAANGAMRLDQFMAMALGHPQHGYYMSGQNFGVEGDFITAPEISQMFGELIGLWALDQLHRQGITHHSGFFELGPGRGTLMADLLRAITPFAEGKSFPIHMLEISPALKARQAKTLSKTLTPSQTPAIIQHHDQLNNLPEIPLVFIANEFFDALPIRQFIKTQKAWQERRITSNGTDLSFTTQPAEDTSDFPDAAIGDVYETAPDLTRIITIISQHINRHGGAALIIDYGKSGAVGDSLQAVRDHKPVDVLDSPGATDLSAWVDFAAIQKIATAEETICLGPRNQGDFLKSLGLYERAEQLSAQADPKTRRMIAAAVDRLSSPAQMGNLFQVMALLPTSTSPEAAGF